MENKKETVCAVVVTYNRKELLLECLEALRKQTRPIQGIYLIDNASTDGTPKLLLEKGYIKELPPENLTEPWEKEFEIKNLTDGEIIKLHYVRIHENTGGAGGFHEGVKRGYEKGFDWLWLMDDDAEPGKETLKTLVKSAKKNKILAICPLIEHKQSGTLELYHHKKFDFLCRVIFLSSKELKKSKILKIEANAFVGPLISCCLIKDIGFPRKEYFIWSDDVEFTYKINKSRGLYLDTNAVIYHKDKKLAGENFWKTLYNLRNGADFRIRFFKVRGYLWVAYRFLRLIVAVARCRPNALLRARLQMLALIDGIRGNFKRNYKIYWDRSLNRQMKGRN